MFTLMKCSANYNLHTSEEMGLVYLCVDRADSVELRKQAEAIAQEKHKYNGKMWHVVCGVCDNHK